MFDERELEKHGREGKDLVGGGIDNFVWEREGLVILCGRERGEESVSRCHITLLPNGPAFSSAVWSPSSICSMPSLKIEVLCMLGCKEAQERVVAV